MTTITMSSKGQVTLPAAMREKFRLSAGTKLIVTENPNGEIILKVKSSDVSRLRGIIGYRGPPVSIEDMNAAIEKAATTRFKASLK